MQQKIVQTLKQILPTNKFARGVSILASGVVIAQLITVLVTPILTRLYLPENFGILAVFSSLVILCTTVACGSYEQAIPLPDNLKQAASLVTLCLILLFGSTLLYILTIFFAKNLIVELVGTPQFGKYLWLVPLGVIVYGTSQTLQLYSVRKKQFSLITKSYIKQSFSMAFIRLIMNQFGAFTLIAGQITGNAVASVTLGMTVFGTPEFRKLKIIHIREVAKRYRRFPQFSVWSNLLRVGNQHVAPLVFAALFTAKTAGLYILVDRVLAIPLRIIGVAVGQVFFVNATEAYREGRLAPLVKKVHQILANIMMPPAIVFIIAGPELFSIIFGQAWEQAGVFARWMAPWMYLVSITSPFDSLFYIMEQQIKHLWCNSALFLVQVSTIFTGVLTGDLNTTLALFCVGSSLCVFGFLIITIFMSGNGWTTLLVPILQALTWNVLLSTPLIIAQLMVLPTLPWLLLLIFTTILIGGRYLYLYRKNFLSS